jgi:hypothetical protein
MPVKRWAPGWGLQRGPPGSEAGVREPRSVAQGPDDRSAAFFGYFLPRSVRVNVPVALTSTRYRNASFWSLRI